MHIGNNPEAEGHGRCPMNHGQLAWEERFCGIYGSQGCDGRHFYHDICTWNYVGKSGTEVICFKFKQMDCYKHWNW